MNLEARISFTRWQNMNFIMAGSAKRLTINNFISQFGKVCPRLQMMNYQVFSEQELSAKLTAKIITSNANITPFNIEDIVSPAFVAKILFCILAFSDFLRSAVRFVCAISRAELPICRIIRVNPKGLIASFTGFKINLIHNQLEYSI